MRYDSVMKDKLFLAESQEIFPGISVKLLFNKEDPPRERCECHFAFSADPGHGQELIEEYEKLRFVIKDNIVSIETILDCLDKLAKEFYVTLESIVSGRDYLISGKKIEISRELVDNAKKLSRRKIEMYIIHIYSSSLIFYIGTDTLQQRKFKKMVEAQIDAMSYNYSGGANA